MCDQTEVSYLPGEVVWVKLRALWWPGLVQDYDALPEEITCSLRKRPIATVKFFQEDSYEYVHKLDLIYHYNCSRKHEFIKKGLDLCRKKTADRPATMDFFPSDVVTAEELTNGDPNILQDKAFKPDEKPKYTSLFGSEKKKLGKKKGKDDSPLKDKFARRKKLTSKLQAMGWLSRGITANIIYPSPDTPRIVTHRRFLNKVRNPEAKSDYESRIMEQKCEEEPISTADKKYQCVLCGYVTRRLNVIVMHFNATHSRKVKNIFSAPSVLKGGSFRNPLLKLKGESRKSESGKTGLFSRKRNSIKGKVDKPKQEDSDEDTSDNDSVKVQPVKEKKKPGRKRKVQEYVEKDDTEERVKKPKVLDSLLADWDEDAEQQDEDLEGDSKPRSEDDEDGEGNESAPMEKTGAGKSSKSKEVFEFDPDEDDSIDFDLTPNVKGFGRRIPRVINSSKDKKQGGSETRKSGKGKPVKKDKDAIDDFESLLAETSIPVLPSVPNSNTFSLDVDDDISKPIVKPKSEFKTTVVSEDKGEKSRTSDTEVDMTPAAKKTHQGHDKKVSAKVTVEKIPDLAVQIQTTAAAQAGDTADISTNLLKNDKPEKSTGGDHTYVGSSGRKRRRSLLPLEKGDGDIDIMSLPIDMIEDSSIVSREPTLPRVEGSKVQPTPRRGRPPRRGRGGRGGRGGSRTLKIQPPHQNLKSPPPHHGSKSPSPHLSSKSPPLHQSSKSPSPQSSSLSPPHYSGPKSPQSQQGSKSPGSVRSSKSPPPEPIPKSPSHRQSSKSPSAHQSPKGQQIQQNTKSPVRSPSMSPPKSPIRSPSMSPGHKSPIRSPSTELGHRSPRPKSPEPKSPGPKSPAPPQSPKSPQPYQSPSRQDPKSPQSFQGSKSPRMGSPVSLNVSPKAGGTIATDSKLMKSPQSPGKASGDMQIATALPGVKSPVKSPVQSPTTHTVLLSPTSSKSPGSKVLTTGFQGPCKTSTSLKKVSTPGAVVVQSKPDLQPEACGIAKTLSLSPTSVASSAGTMKTIKVAMSGTPGSSPVVVGKSGTPGSQPRKLMIVQSKGGQKMLVPTEASQQILSNIGSGKKIMVITKGAGGASGSRLMLTSQQQKILSSGGKITTSSGQVVSSKGTVLSSVSKLISSKGSTPTASTSTGSGIELSSEPPALVKTEGKKTYKIITSPQSKGNILLNTSGGQILLPVSSIAASGSGVTTSSGSKQFLLPVGGKNVKLLSGSGQKVILQMKSPKMGLAQPISPKAVQSITPKTIQSITPKAGQPITPSQPLKVTKIATMIQPVPQLTPIGSPKIGRPKQVKPVAAKPIKSPPQPKSPRKSTTIVTSSEAAVASGSGSQISSGLQKRSIVPNPNLKTIVPQATPSKKISLAAKPAPVEAANVSSMSGTVQVVTGAMAGLEQIQTILPSVETSSAVALPTSTQQFVAGLAEDGSQVMYLIDNSQLIGSLDGSNPANLGNIILTFDNMGQPVASNAATDFTFSAPSSGQDILAEALANTQVLQPEVPGGELGLDTSGLLSSHSSSSVYPPTLSHGVLETSLTLNQPIMTPLEDLSAVSTLQPPPASGVTSVDLPSTITVPDITISTSAYASLPIPSATIQSTVFSEAQNVTTFNTTSADGSVFIEAPVVEGEPFLTTAVYEQGTEGASMPLLDG